MHGTHNTSPPGKQPATIGKPVSHLRLATPTPDNIVDWQTRAVCPQTDPEAFYPEKGCSARDGKAVCQDCPIRIACLDHALKTSEPYGIWGGLTQRERTEFKATGLPAAEVDKYMRRRRRTRRAS